MVRPISPSVRLGTLANQSLGLSLHHKVESLLDKGDIAIVPMPGKIADRTEWRCVVLNESIDKDIVYQPDFQPGAQPETIRVKVCFTSRLI
jgi:hypothetical protein